MSLIKGSQSKPIEYEPGLFALKLIDGSRGSHGVALLRGWLNPGASHSPHTHEAEEAVVFLSGHGEVCIGECRYKIGPGDSVWIPPRIPHSTSNTSAHEDLTFVAAFSDSLIASRPALIDAQPSNLQANGYAALKNQVRWFARRVALAIRGVFDGKKAHRK